MEEFKVGDNVYIKGSEDVVLTINHIIHESFRTIAIVSWVDDKDNYQVDDINISCLTHCEE
jgi:hypothetical protein